VKTFIALGVASLLLIACSTALVPLSTRFAEEERVTCRRVRPTGSLVLRTVCTTKAEEVERTREAREFLEERARFQTTQEAERSVRALPRG